MKVLVFDTETTGLPITKGFNNYYNYRDLEKYNESRLVTICWQVFEEKNLISNNYFIIKPNDFEIDNNSIACKINKITNEIANEQGIDINLVFDKLNEDLKDVERIIGHNLNFDTNILLSELFRGNKEDIIKLYLEKDLYCTMINGINHTKITFKNSTKLKYPNLKELHQHFFKVDFNDAHNAEADVNACAKCYFKMIF